LFRSTLPGAENGSREIAAPFRVRSCRTPLTPRSSCAAECCAAGATAIPRDSPRQGSRRNSRNPQGPERVTCSPRSLPSVPSAAAADGAARDQGLGGRGLQRLQVEDRHGWVTSFPFPHPCSDCCSPWWEAQQPLLTVLPGTRAS